jgi:hypothetical protein
MSSFIDTLTKANRQTGGDELEPAGEEYRPVWRTTYPASLDLRMGAAQFTVQYAHMLLVISGSQHYSAFWIIESFMTFMIEGENLRDVIQSVGDRKARALLLFDPELHKTWARTEGRILKMQPVFVPSDVALAKAAEVFGFEPKPLPVPHLAAG